MIIECFARWSVLVPNSQFEVVRNPLPFENLDRILDELDNYPETGLQFVIPRTVGYVIKFVQIGCACAM